MLSLEQASDRLGHVRTVLEQVNRRAATTNRTHSDGTTSRDMWVACVIDLSECVEALADVIAAHLEQKSVIAAR